MFYIFANADGHLASVAENPIEPMEGYTIVETDAVYDYDRIHLVNGSIEELPPPPETMPHVEEPVDAIPMSSRDIELMNAIIGLSEELEKLKGDNK
ncbi:hypothetical protein H6A02_01825 [Veillonella magna]|uniref:hypothetical protein n=1 Tax=Veillonella magna TaxID=464322 RepID=UPI00195F80A7|nr:hypothetical protein [Veillonella magna]MBM6823725.1 hypothetical protein [Veillonella magna]